jgi:hypothetical protein
MTQELMRVKAYLCIPWNSLMGATLLLTLLSDSLDLLTSTSVVEKLLLSTAEQDWDEREL